jgi:gliding motility-associated protein GldM
MAGGKLTPRQKMINMMYLVLTALLALNVTKEVINAFVTINESVQLSKSNIDKKNQNTYAAFAQAMSVDAAKYKDVNDRANSVKKSANDLVKKIDDLKQIISTRENLLRHCQQWNGRMITMCRHISWWVVSKMDKAQKHLN